MSGGGKGSQQQQSTSVSSSFNQAGTFVDPAQQPFLDFLRSQAQGVVAGQLGQIGPAAFNLAGELGEVGSGALDALTSGLGGGLSALREGLSTFAAGIPGVGMPGAAPQADAAALSGDFIAPTIEALGEDINRQLGRQIGGAGGINTGFGLAGARGGGRNMVERGLAQEAALTTFGREAAGIRLSDAQQRQQLGLQQALANAQLQAGNQALGQQAQIANQQGAIAGSQQELAALLGAGQVGQAELGAQQAALGALPGLQQLGMQPFAAELAPLASLAGILGGPTVLSQAFGTSQSQAQSSSSVDQGLFSALSGFGGFLGGFGTLLAGIE